MTSIRAAQVSGPGAAFDLVKIELPDPGPGQDVVELVAEEQPVREAPPAATAAERPAGPTRPTR